MTETDFSIECTDVEKRYSNRIAITNVNLTVERGEILALLGPNGAGKTTLIKILATILSKDRGTIKILGLDIDQSINEVQRMIGYVGQDTERSAYAKMTVKENLEFFSTLKGLSAKYFNYRFDNLIDFFDFKENKDALFGELSGGQKQTVVIMRALLHDPLVVFLDEPTKGLDPFIARKIRHFLINYVNINKKTLLLTSHILPEVEEMADRIALMYRGSIRVVGTLDELRASTGATHLLLIKAQDLNQKVIDGICSLKSIHFVHVKDDDWLHCGVTDHLLGLKEVSSHFQNARIQVPIYLHKISVEEIYFQQVGRWSKQSANNSEFNVTKK